MHWLDPARWDLAEKMAAASVSIATLLGILWKPLWKRIDARLEKRRQAKADALKKQADALIEAQRQAAVIVAQETRQQLEEFYRMGQEHVLDMLGSIKEKTDGLHTWKGEHTESDEQQFRQIRADVEQIRTGQRETHQKLEGMNETLIRADEGIQWLREMTGNTQERRTRRP